MKILVLEKDQSLTVDQHHLLTRQAVLGAVELQLRPHLLRLVLYHLHILHLRHHELYLLIIKLIFTE